MKIPFTQIRNQIRKYKRNSLLEACYNYIDKKDKEMFPIWNIFLIMKWTYQNAEYNYPSKEIDYNGLAKIYNLVYNFNNDHISNFIKSGKIDQSMQIFYSQQFYLQKQVYSPIFATQLKLYQSIKTKYDIDQIFKSKTGISIFEFLLITHYIWIYIESKKLKDNPLKYFGYISQNIIDILSERIEKDKLENYFRLTVLKTDEAIDKINNFKKGLSNPDLQIFETTFFTLYPYHEFNNKIKVIHNSVFNYFANYFVYDYLKANDDSFTTAFGERFEKYIEKSLEEIYPKFLREVEIKKLLSRNSNLIDFYIPNEQVFIECKTIEIQMYPSVNPTEDLLYSALKDSILKAYYKQLLSVSKQINPNGENWGIILTYKEIFWSDFSKLHELCKSKFDTDVKYLPPKNVFIIDISTWNLIIHVIKSGKASLLDILKLARQNNSDVKTSKQLFQMHLDVFEISVLDLDYLKVELEKFKL